MSTVATTNVYDVTGPLKSDKTIRIEAETGLAACRIYQEKRDQRFQPYHFEEPSGPYGKVIAYVQHENALSKVGAMDISWVPIAAR